LETKVLIADEDKYTVDLIASQLRKKGYFTITTDDGREAFELFRRRPLDLIILSVSLPRVNGITLCRRIRWESEVPIIMLVPEADAKSGKGINGLNQGADDYLTKPLDTSELMARVEAVLRRGLKRNKPEEITYGPLAVNFNRHEVLIDSSRIQLTPTEFDLLRTLIQHPGRVFTREQLQDSIQRKSFRGFRGTERTIDVHINKLRKKIEGKDRRFKFIHTIYGLGYKFESEEPELTDI